MLDCTHIFNYFDMKRKNLFMIHEDVITDFTFFTKDNYSEFISQYADKTNSIEANLLSQKSNAWISNVDTNIIIISLKDNLWPATINYKEYKNASICSPYAIYIKYPLGMIKKFDKLWIKVALLFNASVTGLVYKFTKINQVIQLENNLHGLIKHSSYLVKFLPDLTRILSEKYKNHAITFFRVNGQLDKQLLEILKKSGYIIFPDRTAHIFYPDNNYLKRRDVKRDLKILSNTNYKIIHHDELTEQDIDRLNELYRRLFIDKHSKFNPIYTKEYFRQSVKNRWFDYKALRHPNGRIDAFISWFYRENMMICGPVGYDTAIDQNEGLYRMVIALMLKHAHETQSILNIGSGSDQFKSNRGSTRTLEYAAVYCAHLPFYRRIPWLLLSKVHNAFSSMIFNLTT